MARGKKTGRKPRIVLDLIFRKYQGMAKCLSRVEQVIAAKAANCQSGMGAPVVRILVNQSLSHVKGFIKEQLLRQPTGNEYRQHAEACSPATARFKVIWLTIDYAKEDLLCPQ